MKYYVDNIDYSGLTGFEIIDEKKNILFSINGVDGIGSNMSCTQIYSFSDTDPAYVDFYSLNGEIPTIEITSNYNEYSFLTISIRVIDEKLYWSYQNDKGFFNPACEGQDWLIDLSPNISFSYITPQGATIPSSTYMIRVFKGAKENFSALSSVLSTMNFID